MGEPQPGDFPDGIYIKGARGFLKANQVGNAGDYLLLDKTVDPINWSVVGAGTIGNGLSVRGTIAQLQEVVSSANQAANIVPAAIFGIGSWFYGLAVDDIPDSAYCVLSRLGAVFGFSTLKKVPVSALAVAANVLTVSTTGAHNFKAGDKVTLSGNTPAALNGEVTIAGITDEDTFTAAKVLVNTAGVTFGTADKTVDASDAHVQFIKKSGATVNQGAKDGDVCVFSAIAGGNSQ